MKGLLLPDNVGVVGNAHGILDDFYTEDTAVWTTTATDSGTSTVADGAGGVMALQPSDGTVADNDEVYLQTKELFLIAADKPIKFASYCKLTEANTDDANAFIGLMDAPTANALVDNGAGPKTSFSGAGFYKIDGGTRWQVIFSLGSTQATADLSAANALNKVAATVDGNYHLFEIEIVPKNSTQCDVIFKLDGSTVYKFMDRTYTSATEMAIAFGLKNGGANQETLSIDWVYCYQKR